MKTSGVKLNFSEEFLSAGVPPVVLGDDVVHFICLHFFKLRAAGCDEWPG